MAILKEKEAWEDFMAAACELLKVYCRDFLFEEFYQTFEAVLQIYEEKCPQFLIWKTRLYSEKGKMLQLSGKAEEAIECFQAAQRILENKQIEGVLFIYVLLYQISSHVVLSKHAEAVQLLEKASMLIEKETDVPSDLKAEYHFQKGIFEKNRSNYAASSQHFQQAYDLYSSDNEGKKVDAYLNIKNKYYRLEESDEQQLTRLQKIAIQYEKPTIRQDKYILGNIYIHIAFIYSNIGEYAHALHHLESALALYEEVSSQLYHSRLAAYLQLQQLLDKQEEEEEKRIAYCHQAIEISKRIYGEENKFIAMLFNDLSIFYRRKKDLEKALDYSEKSFHLFEELLGADHDYTAIACSNVGAVWTQQGKFEKGLEYYFRSLKIFKHKLGDKHSNINILQLDIAMNYCLQGKFQEALKHCQLALVANLPAYDTSDFYDTPSLDQFPLTNYNHRGILNALIEKLKYFLDYFHELQGSEATKVIQTALDTSHLLMEYLHKLQRALKVEESKLLILNGLPKICTLCIDTALLLAKHTQNTDSLEKAFDFHEQAKALLLRYSIQENEAKLQSAIDPQLLQQEQAIKSHIETCVKAIQKEEAKGTKKDENKLKEWKQNHFNETLKHQALIKQLEQNYPEYYQLKYQLQSVSLQDLQASLDEQTVLLSYFIGSEKGYVFAVSADDYQIVTLNLPADFEQQIKDYLNAIHTQNFQSFAEKSHTLYCLLIQPLADFIFDIFDDELKNLVIIPDAVLQYLPFETLICEEVIDFKTASYHKLDYLLNHATVQYHYSATLYHQYLQQTKVQRQTDQQSSPTASNAIDFMGFAPVYTSDKQETQAIMRELAADYSQWASRSEAIRGGNLTPLPFSEEEVENIGALFKQKGLTGRNFLYDSATKEDFKTLASQAKYLHIAAHGLTNDQFPKLSGIVFHPKPHASDIHDCVLAMGEIYQLQLNADLVVLSSCESGIGKLAKGEGMMGINRGFLYAGAKNVVYTLFKVLDKPSSELCQAFFAEILKEKSYSEALRQAKLELIQQENIDPKFWCGFVLLGA